MVWAADETSEGFEQKSDKTSKGYEQTAIRYSLIRAFACHPCQMVLNHMYENIGFLHRKL